MRSAEKNDGGLVFWIVVLATGFGTLKNGHFQPKILKNPPDLMRIMVTDEMNHGHFGFKSKY